MSDKVFIAICGFGVLMMGALSTPHTARFFWSMSYDLDLDADCARLAKCLDLPATVLYDTNKCMVTKGEYMRGFHIPELRGSLRACEIIKGYENQRKFGI